MASLQHGMEWPNDLARRGDGGGGLVVMTRIGQSLFTLERSAGLNARPGYRGPRGGSGRVRSIGRLRRPSFERLQCDAM